MASQPVIRVMQNPKAVIAEVQAAEFDHDLTLQLKAEVWSLARASSGLPVVLDLSNVTFVASLTLGTLIDLANGFKQQNQRLVLVGLRPKIRETMRISAIQDLFEIHDTCAAALA